MTRDSSVRWTFLSADTVIGEGRDVDVFENEAAGFHVAHVMIESRSVSLAAGEGIYGQFDGKAIKGALNSTAPASGALGHTRV